MLEHVGAVQKTIINLQSCVQQKLDNRSGSGCISLNLFFCSGKHHYVPWVKLTVCVSISRFPLYYELKIAFVVWLLSPYTRGASLIYRKCLHPLLSSRERVHSSVHPRVMQVTLLCAQFNCVLKCNCCLPLGNRWVHCAGQREKLWDHGELWQAGPEHCSHRCGHCSRQGKLFFFFNFSRECTTVLC